jgi:hypothetical protein
MEFVTGLVQAMAWPIVISVLIVVLRAQARELVGAVTRRVAGMTQLSGPGGFSVTFSEGVKDAQRMLEDSDPPALPHDTPASDVLSLPTPQPDADEFDFARMALVARDAPRGAVLEAFLVLEDALRRAVEDAADADLIDPAKARRTYSVSGALQLLSKVEPREFAIADQLHSTVQSLIRLRNDAAHTREFQLSPADAEEYVRIVHHTVDAVRLHALTMRNLNHQKS